IAAQGSIGLARILSEIPGIQITMAEAGQTGGAYADEYAVNSPANPIYIQIRGSQAYENATLFDGHRVNTVNWIGDSGSAGGQSGAFDLSKLDTNGISSLNIIKGPGADSPTINNATGGVADIIPLTPSGRPSGTLSYGFDGSGGLQLNLSAQGETKNKRLGLSLSATSYTLAGPIGGWPYFNFATSNFATGFIDGTEPISYDFNNHGGGTNYSYLPHINGGFSSQSTPAIGCCVTKFSRDTTLTQQRTLSFLYNIAPTVQIILRYGLNNTLSNYSGTPFLVTFLPTAGYTGKFGPGSQISTNGGSTAPV